MDPVTALALIGTSGLKSIFSNETMKKRNEELKKQARKIKSQATGAEINDNRSAQYDFLSQLAINSDPRLIESYRQKYGQQIGTSANKAYQGRMDAQKILLNKQPTVKWWEAGLGGIIDALPIMSMADFGGE